MTTTTEASLVSLCWLLPLPTQAPKRQQLAQSLACQLM